MYSRIAAASISASAMRILTTSPMETRPISRPLSTTGMWRNRCDDISDISRSIVSASRAVITALVMYAETGSFSTLLPDWPIARTRSRSDTMPATLPSSPSMTTQPMPRASSSFAISSNDLSGGAVTTPLPFSFRIAATFILVSSSLRNFRPDCLRHHVPDGRIAQEMAESKGSNERRWSMIRRGSRPRKPHAQTKGWSAMVRSLSNL